MEWRPDFGVSNRAHVWWRLGLFLVRLLTLNRLMLATPSSAATASRMALTSSSALTRMTNMSRALGPESTRTRTWTTMASEEVPVGVRELVLRRNSPRPIVPQTLKRVVWCVVGGGAGVEGSWCKLVALPCTTSAYVLLLQLCRFGGCGASKWARRRGLEARQSLSSPTFYCLLTSAEWWCGVGTTLSCLGPRALDASTPLAWPRLSSLHL